MIFKKIIQIYIINIILNIYKHLNITEYNYFKTVTLSLFIYLCMYINKCDILINNINNTEYL